MTTDLASLRISDYDLPAAEIARTLSPALVVFLDKVRHNVQHLLALAGGDPDRLRPHLKTTKIPRVWSELVAHGLRHFKCATTREAEHMLAVLAETGQPGDLLVAYPHLGPALAKLHDLAKQNPDSRVSVLCEDPALAAEIPPELGVFIDVNPGMNRTGVPIADREVIARIIDACGARFRGIHHYEGHVHSGTPAQRRERCSALYAELLELVRTIETTGHPVPEVVTSGSPSFVPALESEPLRELEGKHRVSPGTVVFYDAGYAEHMTETDFVPAALVMSRVVSHPTADTITVDAGSKAIAAEAGDPCAVAVGHPNLIARKPSEEHLPFTVRDQPKPPRGSHLWLVPRHVCPTVNLAEEALLVDDGEVLGVFPVSARAHALRY